MTAHLVRVAWQRTAAALVINVVGMPVDIAIGQSVHHCRQYRAHGSCTKYAHASQGLQSAGKHFGRAARQLVGEYGDRSAERSHALS